VGTRTWLVAGLRRGGTHWMVLGSAVGGLGAYLFQVVGTRVLGEEAFAPIGVLWTIQYLLVSVVLYAVETYVTRQTTLRARGEAAAVPTAALALLLAGIAAAVGGATWALRDRLLGGLDDLALVAAGIVLAYGLLAVVRGRFAGTARFQSYGLVTGGESTIRLLFALGVTAIGATTREFAWLMPAGAALAALWVLAPAPNRTPDERDAVVADLPQARIGRFLALTTTANAAAQTLLAGGPLVLPFLGAGPAEVSVFFITVTAARVPMVFAFGGILSRLLPTFTRMAANGDRQGLRRAGLGIGAGGTLVAVLAGGAAAAVGSPLVAAFFGAGFAPPWWLVAAAAAAVMLAASSLLLNQVLIGARAEHLVVAPWLVGLGVGLAVVGGIDTSASARVAAGLLAGEAVALVGLLGGVLRVTGRGSGPVVS
jgi:O-antigen/teichoic acid export membrane protein